MPTASHCKHLLLFTSGISLNFRHWALKCQEVRSSREQPSVRDRWEFKAAFSISHPLGKKAWTNGARIALWNFLSASFFLVKLTPTAYNDNPLHYVYSFGFLTSSVTLPRPRIPTRTSGIIPQVGFIYPNLCVLVIGWVLVASPRMLIS